MNADVEMWNWSLSSAWWVGMGLSAAPKLNIKTSIGNTSKTCRKTFWNKVTEHQSKAVYPRATDDLWIQQGQKVKGTVTEGVVEGRVRQQENLGYILRQRGTKSDFSPPRYLSCNWTIWVLYLGNIFTSSISPPKVFNKLWPAFHVRMWACSPGGPMWCSSFCIDLGDLASHQLMVSMTPPPRPCLLCSSADPLL